LLFGSLFSFVEPLLLEPRSRLKILPVLDFLRKSLRKEGMVALNCPQPYTERSQFLRFAKGQDDAGIRRLRAGVTVVQADCCRLAIKDSRAHVQRATVRKNVVATVEREKLGRVLRATNCDDEGGELVERRRGLRYSKVWSLWLLR